MATVWHFCENIKGLLSLSDYRLKKMAPYFEVDGVPLRTAAQVRRELKKMQAEGMECVPSVGQRYSKALRSIRNGRNCRGTVRGVWHAADGQDDH